MTYLLNIKTTKCIILTLFSGIIILFSGNGVCAAQNKILQAINTGKNIQCAPVSLPPDAKLEATYTLTYNDHVTNEDNLITLKKYSNFSSLTISDKANPNVIFYYEQGLPPPKKKEPMKIFKSSKEKKVFEYEEPPLLAVIMHIEDRSSSIVIIYQLDVLEQYNRSAIHIGGAYPYKLEDIVGDFDNDGNIEVVNLELKSAGTKKDISLNPDIGVRSVYQYVYGGGTSGIYANSSFAYFKRVKGRAFEKIFMEHAEILIDKIYIQLLESKDNNSKKEYEDLEIAVLSWLATVESTQNTEVIKEALARFWKLPYPDNIRKGEIVKLLINDGYDMLIQESGR